MIIYGYARVSSLDQNVARQLDAFDDFGISPENIFIDKQSGKNFDRQNYAALMQCLSQGDLLVIKSIDRLGRNYDAIIREWNNIVNVIGADILVLDMPLLDTRSKQDSLVGKFISDIVLQVLSFVVENERVNIHTRQMEGIASAKSRGVKFGRPATVYSEKFISTCQAYLDHNISLNDALSSLNINRCNFYYHAHRLSNLGFVTMHR